MKTYLNHLKDTKSFGEKLNINYRPTMRSSAVFPCIKKKGKIKSIYTFMGYWLRKRGISHITAFITLRNSKGKKLLNKIYEVRNVKSYVISSDDLVDKKVVNFKGSVEIEIFSSVDMVYPYPAITFALKNENGITFVHTAGRIYNDLDDLKDNSQIKVPETGFDILVGKNYNPFFAFVNGPKAITNKEYKLEFIDPNGKKKICSRSIKRVEPYGLAWIELFEKKSSYLKFKSEKICVKIHHNFSGFFPRFIAGNILNNYSSISLTHTYYDNSKDYTKESTYKNPFKKKYFDSIAAIPFDNSFSEVELAIYPNLSFAPTKLKFELYNENGILLKSVNSETIIASRKIKLTYIKFMDIFRSFKNKISNGMVKIILDGNGIVPTRLKFGLNLINSNNNKNLPSNICFNSNIPNIKIINKPNTFRWCTVFDSIKQKIFLHNTGFIKSGFINSKILVELHRERDDKKLSWELDIKYNGTVEVLNTNLNKIKKFLNGEIGWVSFLCNSPFILGYYIVDYGKGTIGADHIY